MEHQKIFKLLNGTSDSKFVIKKWKTVNDQSSANYDVGNKIIYNKGVMKPNLCDYSDGHILVLGDVTVVKCFTIQVSFNNCVPFTNCITKIDGTTIDDAEGLDLVVPIYNLLAYSSKYSDTPGSLLFYSKDEACDFAAAIVHNNPASKIML